MDYLLLDTCTLRNLFSDLKTENEDIDFLYNIVEAGKIKLITNRLLQEEWGMHKIKQRESTISSIETKKKHAKELFILLGDNEPDFNSLSYEWIDNQIAKIDTIIEKKAFEVQITKEVKARSSDHQEKRKAPFHKKIESISDALIIFSTLEYFNGNNETVIFISDNYTDFSDDKPNIDQLHPDILDDYKNVTIEYYHKTGLGINKLKEKFPEFIPEKKLKIELSKNSFKIDESISYEKNLLNLINYAYKNLNYLPVHIFIDNEIILGKNNDFGYYENFTISTKSELLHDTISELFKKYKTGSNSQSLTNKEVKQIIESFTRNSIYYISERSSNNLIELPQTEQECNCISCCIQKFNFIDAYKKLSTLKEDSLQDISFKSFKLFQFGKLNESFEVAQTLLQKSREKNNSVYRTIAKYNLNKLNNAFTFNLKKERKMIMT